MIIRALAWLDQHAGTIAIIVALAILAGFLVSCGDNPPPRDGSAQATAAGAQARASAAATRADQAGQEYARLAGEAAAAEAKAKATGVQADIDAAVAARVAAVAAEAVHVALRGQEADAARAAREATKQAQDEHAAEQAAQDYRSWVRLCRLVGGAGILGGFLVAAALAWATKSLTAGRWPGLILAGAGALVIALGPATAWMPWLVAAAAALSLAWWGISHRAMTTVATRAAAAAVAGSRAVDAVEREVPAKAKDAKIEFAARLKGAGLSDHVEASRGPGRDWTPHAG
jgi:hypothetical protein